MDEDIVFSSSLCYDYIFQLTLEVTISHNESPGSTSGRNLKAGLLAILHNITSSLGTHFMAK